MTPLPPILALGQAIVPITTRLTGVIGRKPARREHRNELPERQEGFVRGVSSLVKRLPGGRADIRAHKFALAAHVQPRVHQCRMTKQQSLFGWALIKQSEARNNSERIRFSIDKQQLATEPKRQNSLFRRDQRR